MFKFKKGLAVFLALALSAAVGVGAFAENASAEAPPASTESAPAAEPQAAPVQEESAPAPEAENLFEVSSKEELDAAVKRINEAEGGAYIISLTADITLPQSEKPSDFTAYTVEFLKNEAQLLGNGHTIYNAELAVRNGAQLTLGREDGSDSLTLKGYTAGVSGIVVIDGATLNMYSGVKFTEHMPSSNRLGGAVQIARGAVFNMYGGEIVNNGGETAYSYGGGVSVGSADATFNMYGGLIAGNSMTHSYLNTAGGGVAVVGTFNMYGGTISGNEADLGGGICVLEGGVLNLGGGVIEENTAAYGGGIYLGGESLGVPPAIADAGQSAGHKETAIVIRGNRAVGENAYGGGIYSSGGTGLTLNNMLIAGNAAEAAGGQALGGGVYANKTALTVQNTEISGNSVSGNAGGNLANITGGGICVMKSSLNMKNSSVSQNTSGGMAAGIYVSGGTDAAAFFNAVSFSENKAGYLGGGLFLSGIKSELENCTFSQNSAAGCGGGLYVQQSAAGVSACSFTGNAVKAFGEWQGVGGGIGLNGDEAVLTLQDSVLEQNSAEHSGGGVGSIDDTSTICASGRSIIQNNTGAGGKTDNLYLSARASQSGEPAVGQLLHVLGDLTGSEIGVTMQCPPGTFTQGYDAGNSGVLPEAVFTSDDAGYLVEYDGSREAQLVKKSGQKPEGGAGQPTGQKPNPKTGV